MNVSPDANADGNASFKYTIISPIPPDVRTAVTVVVNPKHYDEVAEMIAKDGCTTGKFRMQLAQEAFCHTSHYDDCIQEYLTAQLSK